MNTSFTSDHFQPFFCAPFTRFTDAARVPCPKFNFGMKGLSAMEMLFPKTATEKLHELIQRDIEKLRHSNIVSDYGNSWDQLSEHEADVFGLSLDIMPDLIALYGAYEAVLGICVMYDYSPEAERIFEGVRHENAFLRRAAKEGAQSCCGFQQFGKLFGYPHRLTYAAYFKRELYDYRLGLFAFDDERPSYLEGRDV